MIKAIESDLYRIEKAKGYEHEAIKIIKKRNLEWYNSISRRTRRADWVN